MISLIEFPDINTFFIDIPVKTIPDFIANSNIVENLSYQIEWWYINDIETKYIHNGQNITFSSPSYDIDFHCYIIENENIYDTTEILGFNFHLKVLPADINYYFEGEHESIIYDGYEDFNFHSGIKHNSNFKENGISGYNEYSGVYLPVLNIIDSENVRLQQSYNDVLLDENLNPIYDDERDSFNLFEKYKLDPTKIEDQENFVKIQKFEQENFTLYNKKSSMIRILKPIDDQMVRLYNRISALETDTIINNIVAGEDIPRHYLVSLVEVFEGGGHILKVFKANAYTIIENGNTTYPRRCYGIALKNTIAGEICKFKIRGRIFDYSLWRSEGLDVFRYLGEFGRLSTLIPDPDDIKFSDPKYNPPVIYQELGYHLNNDELLLDIKQPILLNAL